MHGEIGRLERQEGQLDAQREGGEELVRERMLAINFTDPLARTDDMTVKFDEQFGHAPPALPVKIKVPDGEPVGQTYLLKVDARTLVTKRAVDYKDFEDQIKVAHAYGALDSKRSFEIIDAGIAERIEWMGTRPHEVVLERLNRADLFLLGCEVSPNGDRDGIPNVLVEAMAASMISAMRSVTDLRFIGVSWAVLTMDESSGLNRIQVFKPRPDRT